MLAVMNALLERDPHCRFFIRTASPRKLFNGLPAGIARYSRMAIDTGMIEKDNFSQDPLATLRHYQKIEDNRQQLIKNESAFILSRQVKVIVSDIPPLASEIGSACGIPVIGCANFSWDFNYQPYARQYPRYSHLIKSIRASYRKTTLLLRLPFHHSMDAFPVQKDIPLVARQSAASPVKTRLRLGISKSEKRPVILVAFRIDDQLFRRALVELTKNNDCLIITYGLRSLRKYKNIIVINDSRKAVPYTDILRACTLVIAKIGYSTLAECIAARVPLMYPPRENYPEFKLLHNGAKKSLPSYLMPKRDFASGKWRRHIDKFLAQPISFPSMPANGARVAAEIILRHASK